MGRAEKRFQKKKDREREVRKKILKKLESAHKLAKEIEAQNRLEREVSKAERKKQLPLRRMSPELRGTLELVEKIKSEEEKQKENDAALAEKIRGRTKDMIMIDDAPIVGFAPKVLEGADVKIISKNI